jgi:hypothetical protein
VARKTIQRHFLPAVPSAASPFSPASRTPSPAFTMADLRVHDDRSSRSRWPIFAFTMTDLAVHDGPILAFTMVRNSHSAVTIDSRMTGMEWVHAVKPRTPLRDYFRLFLRASRCDLRLTLWP